MAKILIVDDSKATRDMLVNKAKALGHEVVSAVNGLEGLTLCKQTKFDLIMTDLHMPIMNGFEMSEKIREECELNKETRIICVSSDTSIEARDKAEQILIDGWMMKPFNEEHITSLIKRTVQ